MPTKEKAKNLNSYHSKIVGVTFEGRQDVIAQLNNNTPLRFRREPENEHDENAVAIDALVEVATRMGSDNMDILTEEQWLPIGYIARDKNRELAQLLSDGKEAHISISEITGGGDKSFGVNVYIEHERQRKADRSENAVLVRDFFGNEIFWNPVAHEYTNALGEVYLSGSAYASDDDFDADYWAQDAVTRYELDQRLVGHIKEMWKTNGEASRSYGNAIHAAIELYGTYHSLADVIDIDKKTGKRKEVSKGVEKNSALSKLPHLRDATLKFFTPERLAEKAYYEVLIVDHKNKRAGRIDRLVVTEDGKYLVRDQKTNVKIAKKERDGYSKQLSFYGDLIIANGKELGDKPAMLHHWNGVEWKDIELEKIDTLS